MGRVFVVEARRLFPLLFLLVLLISLSIYDNLRQQVTAPVFEQSLDELTFSVIDGGKMEDRFEARVLYEKEDFLRVAQEFALELPDYPFQPAQEVALLVVNGTLKKAQMVPLREGNQLRVTVDKSRNTYHLISLNKSSLEGAGEWYWVFADTRGNVLSQMPGISWQVEIEEDGEGEGEEEKETVNIVK